MMRDSPQRYWIAFRRPHEYPELRAIFDMIGAASPEQSGPAFKRGKNASGDSRCRPRRAEWRDVRSVRRLAGAPYKLSPTSSTFFLRQKRRGDGIAVRDDRTGLQIGSP